MSSAADPDAPPPVSVTAAGDVTIGGSIVGRDLINQSITQNITQIHARALSAVEEAEQQQALEMRRLAEGVSAVAQRLQAAAAVDEVAAGANPYKGLLEYRLNDAEFFFGRERAIRELLAQLERGPLTILHSESGAGKTSLLQAGLAPQLLARGQLPVYLRPYNTEPQYALKRAFLPDLRAATDLATAPMREFLRRATEVLGPGQGLCVMLDQFEEFFTQLRPPEREEFVAELADCLQDASLKVRWVLALRTEYFGNLANFRPQIQNPFANDFRLNRLTREEARQVIEAPAARVGLQFEAGLVETILDDLGREAIAPPQMQLVCSALFDELPAGSTAFTRAQYAGEGGAAGILQGHLERVLSRDLRGEQRAAARRLLESLISSEQQRVVRTHAELVAELAQRGITPQTLDVILRQLVDSRLVRALPGEAEAEFTYELSHDYLLGQIQLDPAVQARKAAQELLEQEVRSFRHHQTLLTADRLQVIEPYLAELTLTAEAEQLLTLSRAEVAQAQQTAEAQRQKELEDARKLAESERQRATERAAAAARLQTRNRLVTAVGAAAGVLAVIAFVLFGQASAARDEAERQRLKAVTQEAVAVAEQARAEAAAARAETEAQRAEAEAQRAAQEARQARLGLSGQFAAQALTARKDGLPQTSLLLALEALTVTRSAGEPDVALAQHALLNAGLTVNTTAIGPALAQSADGQWVATYGVPGAAITLHHLTGPRPSQPTDQLPIGAGAQVVAAAFSADSRWLIAAVRDGEAVSVRGWPLTKEAAGAPHLLAADVVGAPAFGLSHTGQWLVAATDPPRLLDLTLPDPAEAALALNGAPTTYPPNVLGYEFAPGDRWLLARPEPNAYSELPYRLTGWDLTSANPATPRLQLAPAGGRNGLTLVSGDGRQLALAYQDEATQRGIVEVVDLTRNAPTAEVVSREAPLAAGLFSAGRWLITLDLANTTLTLWDRTAPETPVVLNEGGLAGMVQFFRLSPDQRWLVTQLNRATETGDVVYGPALVYDLAQAGALEAPALSLAGEVSYNFDFTPDSRWLMVREPDITVYLLDLSALTAPPLPLEVPVQQTALSVFGNEVVFSPDGRRAAVNAGSSALVWDLSPLATPGEAPASIPGYVVTLTEETAKADSFDSLTSLQFSPDNAWLGLVTSHGRAAVAATDTLSPYPIYGADTGVSGLVFTADSQAALTTGDGRWLDLAGTPLGHRFRSLSPDGNTVLTSRGADQYLWEVRGTSLPPPQVFRHPAGVLIDGRLSPDNRWLATYHQDGLLRLWDLRAPRPTASPAHTVAVPMGRAFTVDQGTPVTAFYFSPAGDWLLLATEAGVFLWDTTAFDTAIDPPPSRTQPAEFFPAFITGDGRWLLGARTDLGPYTPQAIDLRQPAAAPLDIRTANSLYGASPDGRWLLTADAFTGQTPELWDLSGATPTPVPFAMGDGLFLEAAFSPDGQWLAIFVNEAGPTTTLVYALQPVPRQIGAWPGEALTIGAHFLADQAALVEVRADQARLIDLAAPDATPISLPGFSVAVFALPAAFPQASAPAGGRFAFLDAGVLRLWDLAAPTAAPAELLWPALTTSLHFSANGAWLVLTDGFTTNLVSLDEAAWVDRACSVAGRNLTSSEWLRLAPGQAYRRTCPQFP